MLIGEEARCRAWWPSSLCLALYESSAGELQW